MRILYVDNFLNFSGHMLAGALLDAGADICGIRAALTSAFPEANIKAFPASCSMIEGTFAEISIPDNNEKINLNSAISFASNMTLPSGTKAFLKRTLTLLKAGGDDDFSKSELFYLVALCVCVKSAMESLDIDYTVCVGIKCKKSSNSEKICTAAHAHAIFTDEDFEQSTLDTAFLAALCNDYSPAPDMDIIKIGYGAAQKHCDTPALVRAVVGEQKGFMLEEELFFETVESVIL